MKFSLEENLTEKEKIYDRFLLLLTIQVAVSFVFLLFNFEIGKSGMLDYYLFPLLVLDPVEFFIGLFVIDGISQFYLCVVVYIILIVYIILLWKRLITMAQRKNLPFIGNINNYVSFKNIFLNVLKKSLVISAIITLIIFVIMFISIKFNISFLNWHSSSNEGIILRIINDKLYVDILVYFIRAFIAVLATYMICYLVCKKSNKVYDQEKLEEKYEKTIQNTLVRTLFIAGASFFTLVYKGFITSFSILNVLFIIYLIFSILIKNLCYDKIVGKKPLSLKNRIITMVKLVVWFVFLTICITFVKNNILYWFYYGIYATTINQKLLYLSYIMIICLTYFLSTLDIKKNDKNDNLIMHVEL